MTNILVTGATGFIGSHLVNSLKKDSNVVSLVHDSKNGVWLGEAFEGTIKVQGDIRSLKFLKRVIHRYEIDQVFHLAALPIVKTAFKDPINTFEVNVMGTVNVLEACRQMEVDKILVQSSDKVYGNQLNAEVGDKLFPTEPYGTSKICADLIAQTFSYVYDMDVVVVRSCNVYGYDPWNNRIIPNTVKRCLSGIDPVIFRGDKSLRQYIYIDDEIKALICFMRHYSKAVCNLATDDIKNQRDVVLEVLKHFPDRKPVYIERPRLKEIESQTMIPIDYSPLWEPEVSFESGIKLTIEKFKEYEEDWISK